MAREHLDAATAQAPDETQFVSGNQQQGERERQIARLAQRCAHLNPQASEIGAGMLALLVEDAQVVIATTPAPAEPKPRGRRRVHATPAAKVAAHRAKGKRIDYLDSERIHNTIAGLAKQFDCSKNDVVKSLVRFALTNRNWKQQGLYRLKGGEQ